MRIALKFQDIMGSLGDIMVGELRREVGLAHLLFAAVGFDAHHQLIRSPRRRRKGQVKSLIPPRRGWLVVSWLTDDDWQEVSSTILWIRALMTLFGRILKSPVSSVFKSIFHGTIHKSLFLLPISSTVLKPISFDRLLVSVFGGYNFVGFYFPSLSDCRSVRAHFRSATFVSLQIQTHLHRNNTGVTTIIILIRLSTPMFLWGSPRK